MKFCPVALLLLMSAQAFAMPCDTGYLCASKSGKYKIEIRHCRYDNHLGNIIAFQIGGKSVTDATLGPAFDGSEFGGFEIDLAPQGDAQRILSAEWLKKTGKGTIRDMSRNYNPGPYTISGSEAITCKDEG